MSRRRWLLIVAALLFQVVLWQPGVAEQSQGWLVVRHAAASAGAVVVTVEGQSVIAKLDYGAQSSASRTWPWHVPG